MPAAETFRCRCGLAGHPSLPLHAPSTHICVAAGSPPRAQVRAGDTRRINGALSSLARWLCQLEPGDRARGVAVVAPSRRKDLDQPQAVAIFGEVQFLSWLKLAAGMVVLPSSITSTRMP